MIIKNFFLILSLLFLLATSDLSATIITTQSNGNWNNSSTWGCSCTPTATDDVILNHNVTIQSGNPEIISSITINSGATLTVQDDLTFTGVLTVSGTITFNALSATMSFNDIVINSSGTWNTMSTITPMISGNFTNDGSFTSGSGQYTFTSSNGTAIISGNNSISIYMLSFNSGAQYTNNGTIYVNNISGAGTLTQGSNSYLRISGTASLMTLNAGTNPNVVEYNGSTQTIRPANYWDLILAGTTANLGGATTIISDLKINNGTLNTGTFQITTNPGDSMIMKTNTVFTVGSTGSAQVVDFPFFDAYQFDNSSTVSYQGNYNQQVLASYSNLAYGNLMLTTGAASVVKSLTGILPSPFTLIVNGNLNIASSKVNFNMADDFVNVGGDLQGTGMIQMASGRINVKGNFSNTGGFSAGTGTVNYNGTGSQNVRTVAYWNLILSGSGIKILLGATNIDGNLIINGSALLDVSASNYSLTLNGSNWVVSTTAPDPFIERNGTVFFTDNDGLPDTLGGTDTITFYNLEINQVSKSGIVFTAPVFIIDSIIPISGVVRTSTGSELVLSPMASTSAGNDSSFVDGPMVKFGAVDVIFPVGAGNKWAPLGISSLSGDDNTYFTAQYFNYGFGNYSSSFIDHISELEYWTLNRSGTLTPADVTLFWKNQPESQINDYANITVARFNGTNWVDEGRSAMDSTNPGSVTSYSVSNFSPFTFGSYAGGGSNPFILANTIAIDSLSDSAFCSGEIVVIWFSGAGTFSNGNVFYAELSDAAGNFSSPDTIGTLAAMIPGVIIGTIPVVPTGNGYRIRVVSTLPPVTGSDNGSNLSIGLNANMVTFPVSCNGKADGSIDLTPAGGTAPYTYNWTGGYTTEDIDSLTAGTYSVTVTDANSCTFITLANITQPPALAISITGTDVSGYGGNDGSATVVPSGGTPPYNYLWNDTGAQTNSAATGLSAGIYSVFVTDLMGCTVSDSIMITEPAPGQCGLCDAGVTTISVDLSASPDTVWSINGIARNNYCCGATGGLKCIRFNITLHPQSEMISFDVTSPSPPGGTTYQIGCGTWILLGNSFCVSGLTSACLVFCKSGGDLPNYIITVQKNTSASSDVSMRIPCSDTISVSGLSPLSITWTSVFPGAPGNYDSYLSCLNCDSTVVTISDTSISYIDFAASGTPTGCASGTSGDTVRVNIAPSLTTQIIPQDPAICFGSSGVGLTANGSGGSAPYSYLWNTAETTQSIVAASPGIYWVDISDNTNCDPVRDSVPVVQFNSAISASAGSDQTVCAGNPVIFLSGSVSEAGGGIWSSISGSPGMFNPDANSLTVDYTPSLTEIMSGSVTLKLISTGNKGCPADSDFMVLTITPPPSLSTSATFDYDTCNGTATATATGGTFPYYYLWNDPSTSTSDTVTGLCGGVYHVTVTDNNNCTATDSANVITALVSFTVDTNGGCVPVTVNFTNTSNLGVSGVAYLWYFGSDGPYFIYDTSYTFTSGGMQTIWLFAIDADTNILGSDSININFSGSSGFFVMTADTVCPGDNIIMVDDVNVSPYYDWNFGDGFYQNGTSNLATHSWFSPGNYIVSLAINTACGPDTIVQPVVVNNISTTIGIIQTAPQPVCPGDNLQIASFGSSGNFEWNFGDSITGYSGVPYTVHAYANPGTYIIGMTVTDGCGSVQTGSDTVTVSEGVPISGNFEISANPNPVCPGDMVKFKFKEGENFSNYLWDFGDGNAASGSATQYHSYSLAGNYTVSVTVTNGCGSSTVVTVPVAVQNGVSALIEEYSYGVIPDNACPGDSVIFYIDGITGGGYVWDFGDGVIDSIYLPMDSSAIIWHAYSDTGIYQVTITVTNSCGSSATGTMAVWVSNSFPVVPSWWGEGFTWEGRNFGPSQVCSSVTFFAFSGSIFKWNFGDGDSVQTVSTSVDHMYTSAGTYTVSLEVTNSCGNSKQFLSNIAVTGSCLPPSVSDTSAPPLCNGGNDGWILVSATGGIPPYTFQWSNGESNIDSLQSLIDTLAAGTYILTLTDATGGVLNDTIVLTQPPSFTLATSSGDVTCNDTCDGSISVTAAGGSPPYTYLWSSGENSPSLSALCIGVYTVTLSDSLGCSQSQSFTIGGVPGFFADLTSNPDTDWISPATVRNELCCTAITPDVCVHFLVNVDSLADRVFININSGAVPPGSNFYLDNCDPASTTMLGDTLCMTSGGMHNFTYCKPGNNLNDYIIGTRKKPVVSAGNDLTVCPDVDTIALNSTGSAASSYLWLSSGFGSFYPSSMVLNPVYLPTSADKASGSVELVLVGTGTCTIVKDTMLIQFSAPVALSASSTPECEPSTGIASVSATGGTPPYTYLWSNGESQSAVVNLQSAVYSVTVIDAAGCSNSATATVGNGIAFTAAITALTNPSCNGGSDGTATAIGSNIPSQSFSAAPNALIPDAGCSSFNGVNSMINVSGYSSAVNSAGIKVTLNINHTYDLDLQIFLTAPNGNTLMLSTGNGGNDSNYINTVFTDGALTSITMGYPPFTGIFRPEGGTAVSCGVTPDVSTFSAIGGGSINPNGNWSLRVYDNLGIDTGRVVNWVLTIPPVPVSGADFSYQWNDPASQTDSLATGLAAGIFNVIITDTSGCDDTTAVTLIAPPANTGSQTLMICSGDSIQLPDLSWATTAGIYTDTVNGTNGCDSIVTTNLIILPYATFNNSIYYEHFESGNAGWYGGGINSSWQLGTPSATFINSAASGVNAWVTNLAGNYNLKEYSYISSPCFDMSAFGTDPTLRFSHIYAIEKNYDEHWVEVSDDGGNTWTKLGSVGSGINWYNNPVTNIWDSVSGPPTEWEIAEHELTGTAGQSSVIIRFVLTSDFLINDEGAGVDDVYIGPLPTIDAGAVKVLQPVTGCNDSSENVVVVIKNFGYGNISNVPVSYSINGGPTVTETATGTIIPGDSLIYTFTFQENLSLPGTYYLDAWASLPGDSFPLNDMINGYFFQTSPICCIPAIDFGCGLDYIDDVVFAGISNLSSGCNGNPNGYIYYSSDTAVVTKGASYTIQVTPSGGWYEGISVWIDYNKNGSFGDAGEFVFSADSALTTVNGNINIPLSAQLGLTYMRIIIQYLFTPTPGDYCDSILWGETEDYPVMILPVTTAPDVGVIEIFNPGSSCSLSSAETVSVKIKNFGTDSVNLIPVRYRVNGGLPVSDLVNATIGPGDTLMYDFTNTYDFSADGIYSIDAWTAKALDYDPSNDSILNVIVENFTDISVTALTKNATCGDVNNGAIFLDFISGIPPFIGSWTSTSGSGKDTLYASDTLVKNVAPGQYNILLTDSNGCIDSLVVTISSPPLIVSTFTSVTDVSCGGLKDGAIDLSVTGGTPPYWYLWLWLNNMDTIGYSQDVSNLDTGWYAVGIMDLSFCDDTNIVHVSGPPPILLSYSTTADSCSPSCEGTASATVTNGVPPLMYLWNNGSTGLSATGLCGGYASITVTDSTNCVKQDSISIPSLNIPSPVVASSLTYCMGDVIDTIKAAPQSGGILLWYDAPPPVGTPIDSGILFLPALITGTNWFYVTERNVLCESPTSDIEIALFELPPADAGADATICLGERAQLNASGGISYLWKPAIGLSDTIIFNPTAKPADTTEYFVRVTDVNNCTALDSVTVFVDATDNCWHVYNMFSPNGDGNNDEWIIDGIVRFPENKVAIYNRYEDMVKELINYDNFNVIWKGESNSNEPLPGGTYFYVIDVGEKKYSGWVQVIR